MKRTLNEEIARMKTMMNVMGEVSDEVYNDITTKYSDARLIMSSNDTIQFKPNSNQEVSFKPKGLWYGIGDSWLRWVRSEMPDWEADNVFKIDIDESKILKITNYDELVEFEKKYTAIRPVDRTDFRPSAMMASRYPSIDWAKVANDYAGIEIAPYIYKARYDHMWYYGWDVASGCIWGDGVITNITKLNDNQVGESAAQQAAIAIAKKESGDYDKDGKRIKESETGTRVICDDCGWSWKKSEGGDDMYMCHKCGHDNTPEIDEARDAGYLSWKRKNVTIRGVAQDGEENGGSAMLGRGLYTAFLSNRALAKQYGAVKFVVNAIPKNPKVFNSLNDWEIWFYNTLVFKYSKEQGKEFPDRRDFSANTTIEDEMQKMGFDGIVIKGREMVNFKPENVVYFKDENQLEHYYHNVIKNDL